jgi:hypothetical protein
MMCGHRLVWTGCGGSGEIERFNWACTDWSGDFEGGECVYEYLSSATLSYGRTVISMMNAARRTVVDNDAESESAGMNVIQPVTASLRK